MILSILRGTHIFAGFLALFAGLVAFAGVKGGEGHRAAGLAFVILGRLVVVSAVISSLTGVFDPGARLGALSGDERAQALDIIPVFFGVLGVLGLLAAHDLERGLAAIRRSSTAHLRVLAVVAGLAGGALLGWCMLRIADGRGGVSWFGVVIGAFGIETLVRKGIRRPEAEGRMLGHASGMIDAFFGFFAAFTIFGAGRLFNLDFFGGDIRIAFTVAVVVGAGHLVNSMWRRRIEGGHRGGSADRMSPLFGLSRQVGEKQPGERPHVR